MYNIMYSFISTYFWGEVLGSFDYFTERLPINRIKKILLIIGFFDIAPIQINLSLKLRHQPYAQTHGYILLIRFNRIISD